MKLTKIAATAAPAILAMMVANTSWANCDSVGANLCVTGTVRVQAASNDGGYKFVIRPSTGPDVPFCLSYGQAADKPFAFEAKLALLGDGEARSVLYSGSMGTTTVCPGLFLVDGPVRNANFP